MTSRIDCEFEVLKNAGFVGTIFDMEMAWLNANGGTGATIADAWAAFLTARGIPGPGASLDRRLAWLKSYPPPVESRGTFIDAWKWFWCVRGSATP